MAPGQQSVEEVLHHRLNRQPRVLTASRGISNRPSSLLNTKDLSSSNRALTHKSTASSILSAKSSTFNVGVQLAEIPPTSSDIVQQIPIEIASLDQRLRCVATDLSTSPTDAATKQETRYGNDERNAYEVRIGRYLQKSTEEVVNAHDADGNRNNAEQSTFVDTMASAQINHCVRDIWSTVRRLDKVYLEVISGDQKCHQAATKISTMCRRFLVRHRSKRFQVALGKWRSRRCNIFFKCAEKFAAHDELIIKQIMVMQQKRTQLILRRMLAGMRDVVLLNLPSKMARLEETNYRFQKKQRNLLKFAYLSWKSAAIGPRSRKNIAADARARHNAARQRLETMKRFDIITQKMVHEEFIKDNIRQIRSRHPNYVLRRYFHVLKDLIFISIMKKNLEIAIKFDRRRILKRVIEDWTKIVGATRVVKCGRTVENRTLKRFDQHFNLRKIDALYQRTHMLKHLLAWARHSQLTRRVQRLFEASLKKTLIWIIENWRALAQYQHALRDNVVEEWRGYTRRMHTIPFRHWYIYMARRRTERAAKEFIGAACERRHRRRTKYTFFRLWMHQTLFGHIEGFHSKSYLLHSLEDQKRMCLGLEANATLYKDNIAALQASIVRLENKLMEKQHELTQLHATTQATRFSIHQAEQSVERVHGMLEAVRTVHPGTVERIETMYRENPMLSKDLQDVITLHADKRRELLSKIELDQTELEVRNASKGTNIREDQMLLHRVKWVLSRLDLGVLEQSDNYQYDMRMANNGDDTLKQLCALFEFIRNGDTALLTTENSPAFDPIVQSNNHSDRIVCRADIVDGSETWHSFLKSLTLKFVPNNLLSVKERLVRRAAEMDAEVAEIKANSHLYHLYRNN